MSAYASQPEDWDQTDHGHRTIYELDPLLVPASEAARVIYELRLDIVELSTQLTANRLWGNQTRTTNP